MNDNQYSTRIVTAVIPVTDSDHKLLPLHFSFDPGPDFEWENFGSTTDPNSMSYNPSYNPCLGVERKESENLDLVFSQFRSFIFSLSPIIFDS